MGGAELRNLEGLGYPAKRPVGDLIVILFLTYRVFLTVPPNFQNHNEKQAAAKQRYSFKTLQNSLLSKFFLVLVMKTRSNNKNITLLKFVIYEFLHLLTAKIRWAEKLLTL